MKDIYLGVALTKEEAEMVADLLPANPESYQIRVVHLRDLEYDVCVSVGDNVKDENLEPGKSVFLSFLLSMLCNFGLKLASYENDARITALRKSVEYLKGQPKQ